jgi:two-component system phosphate regulon response regulator PhoB
MLPGISGIDICKALKENEKTASIPIIMLTAKGEEIHRVVGFEVGADDYMSKPFIHSVLSNCA